MHQSSYPLQDAVIIGDNPAISQLPDSSYGIDEKVDDGNTPLIICA